MTRSSQNVGQDAVDKFKSWLATSPVIPIHNNRVNKAEICRRLGITRSTVGSNPQLRALFASLADGGPAPKAIKNKHSEINKLLLIIHDLHTELASARNMIVELRRQILLEEHLLFKGQIIDE